MSLSVYSGVGSNFIGMSPPPDAADSIGAQNSTSPEHISGKVQQNPQRRIIKIKHMLLPSLSHNVLFRNKKVDAAKNIPWPFVV